MFCVRANPNYVPGGVHNFWTLQPECGDAQAKSNIDNNYISNNMNSASNMIEPQFTAFKEWKSAFSWFSDNIKGDTSRYMPDLLGLDDCATDRLQLAAKDIRRDRSSSAASSDKQQMTGWRLKEAASFGILQH